MMRERAIHILRGMRTLDGDTSGKGLGGTSLDESPGAELLKQTLLGEHKETSLAMDCDDEGDCEALDIVLPPLRNEESALKMKLL